jgi:predicted Fe-Mo cluster-binding NifX family protein
MKIAVTSQNFKTITGHAGKARRFILFAADTEGKFTEFERLDLPKHMSMHEFSGEAHPLDQVELLITAGCGAGFVRKMAIRGVDVIQTAETNPFEAVKRLASGQELPPITHQDEAACDCHH